MLKGKFPIDKFKELKTPFYYYDIDLLNETLQTIQAESGNTDIMCTLPSRQMPIRVC